MEICSVEFPSLTFNCHLTLTTQTHHTVSENLRWDLKKILEFIPKHHTQRISSGLNFDRHLRVSSSIFFDLSRFPFRASKYLLKHASVQYCKLCPESGPIAALSSLICMRNISLNYIIIQNTDLFSYIPLWRIISHKASFNSSNIVWWQSKWMQYNICNKTN